MTRFTARKTSLRTPFAKLVSFTTSSDNLPHFITQDSDGARGPCAIGGAAAAPNAKILPQITSLTRRVKGWTESLTLSKLLDKCALARSTTRSRLGSNTSLMLFPSSVSTLSKTGILKWT